MSKPSNITGERYGRLVAIRKTGRQQYPCGAYLSLWLFKCDCGNEVELTLSAVTSGNTTSCGCYKKECLSKRSIKHGLSHTRLYTVWKQMKKRCGNPHDISYKYYGGKGIKVCAEWEHDFSKFSDWMMQQGYCQESTRGEQTIDRIDPNRNYEPDNCRILTIQEQQYAKKGDPFEHYTSGHAGAALVSDKEILR